MSAICGKKVKKGGLVVSYKREVVDEAEREMFCETVEKFLNSDTVIVTKALPSFIALHSIIDSFVKEKRTFAVLGNPSGTYVLVREIEPEYEYELKTTGLNVMVSDYNDHYGVPRHIVSDCPDGTLVKFYYCGKEIYFDTTFCARENGV